MVNPMEVDVEERRSSSRVEGVVEVAEGSSAAGVGVVAVEVADELVNLIFGEGLSWEPSVVARLECPIVGLSPGLMSSKVRTRKEY